MRKNAWKTDPQHEYLSVINNSKYGNPVTKKKTLHVSSYMQFLAFKAHIYIFQSK